MKKIIGILGIIMIAMAMFLNTSANYSSNGNFDLASLTALSIANAESGGVSCPYGSCTHKQYFAGNLQWECSACCNEEGDTPKCNQFGCTCE
ncbi:hypothetical protein [Jejuia pallidilutea]|uniref:Uncharacterized protein n=4 Tax=Jejuia pallidilutea TaxID=504487 RepID=A0A098LS22_9FLAO|nr:hypothetical protein [Jejuia pallidilutea]GAL89711.1 hypothetical protein JCM19538_2757 [Jejuia pallidilutea]